MQNNPKPPMILGLGYIETTSWFGGGQYHIRAHIHYSEMDKLKFSGGWGYTLIRTVLAVVLQYNGTLAVFLVALAIVLENLMCFFQLQLRNKHVLKQWIHCIGKKNLPINGNSRICSKHFHEASGHSYVKMRWKFLLLVFRFCQHP